jgi:hypothetical protein
MPPKVDLKHLFHGLQRQMMTKLGVSRETISHPTAKGDVSEDQWRDLLREYLPQRYSVAKAFVVDCNAATSDQIDIVIFDRQYCPFILNERSAYYIPAESVYAVFEVKQNLTLAHVREAAAHAASVRRLKRTSAPIPTASGVLPPRAPTPILAGLLTLESDWTPPFGEPFRTALGALAPEEQLDVGCSLTNGAYAVQYAGRAATVKASPHDEALVAFMMTLLQRLQDVGTVPAMDLRRYGNFVLD